MAASFVLVCWAPILSYGEDGLLAAFRWFAADTFYYLTVASRSVGADVFTFDGTHPVNGFHPLWCAWLHTGFSALGLDAPDQVRFAFFSSVLLTALGAAWTASAALRLTRRPELALLAVVPGFWAWWVPTANPQYGAIWSFANGMETPLTVLFFGLLADRLAHRGLPRDGVRVLATSALLTLLTLSRLDDVFVFVPFLLAAWALSTPGPARVRLAAAWVAIPTVVLGGYLAWNLSYAGAALPLSGASKASGLAVLRNTYAVLTTLLPWADVARDASLGVWGSEAWRVLQMTVPAAASAAWILSGDRTPDGLRRRLRDRIDGPLLLLSGWVVVKSAYNFAFVPLWHQGHWYYPASIATFDLLAAVVLARLLPRPSTPRVRALVTLVLAIFLTVSASTWASMKAGRDDHVPMFALWEAREALEADLERACPGCGVLSFDDGIVAYALARPTMNGLGLELDREGVEARKQGRLLELAHRRGFDLITTLDYPFAEEGPLRERLASWPQLAGQDLEGFAFELAHRDPASGAVFIRFRPAER
jgi:hypothetical protein